MQDLEAQLDRWVDAGLLDRDQAAAIAAHEAAHEPTHEAAHVRPAATSPSPPPPPSAAPSEQPAPTRRVAGAEAVGYVGAALVVGALSRLLAELWGTLTVGGKLALVALATVLAFGAAAALQREARPAVTRLTSVLLAVGVLGTAWFVGLVAAEVLDTGEVVVVVAASGAASVVAVGLHLWRRRGLGQVVALVSLVVLSMSALQLPALPPSPAWSGLLLWGLGVAWLLAGRGGWIPPATLAGVLGGLTALVGSQVASVDDPRLLWLLVGVATAGALVGLALVADALHHLVVGSLGLFVFVPQVVFELFGDAIGGPAALLVVGLLLVVLAVGLGRAGREVVHDARQGASS